MLDKISVFFVLVGLLFLICPLYAQDTQTDVASKVAELKEQVQNLHERVQEKKNIWFYVQVVSSAALVIVTIGLVVCTYALWWATNKYRIATEHMAETQEKASAIQEKTLKVDRINVIIQAGLNPAISDSYQPDKGVLSKALKELEREIKAECEEIKTEQID